MSATDSAFYGDSSFINVKPDRWTKCEFIYTLDDTAVSDAKQAGMLTLSAEGNMSNIYIDDIDVQELVSDVQIVSKENTLGTGFAPRIVLDPVNSAVIPGV